MAVDPALARQLVLDELLDLRLYEALRRRASGELAAMLDKLVAVEARHLAFWQDFFKLPLDRLDARRRLKLALLSAACRVLGPPAAHLTLEAIEIYGVRKYLAVWEECRGSPLGQAVRGILEDEFGHEDEIVSELAARRISPERVRSAFLGFNDGLVEILGAVSGFFAAFDDPGPILAAGLTVSVAGAISMAAGAYVASSSEEEIQATERGKARFLGRPAPAEPSQGAASLGLIVGACYLLGAFIPLLPVLLGARSPAPSLATAGAMIILVSAVLSFLSGMEVRRRILTNLGVMGAAVGLSWGIGTLAKSLWGI